MQTKPLLYGIIGFILGGLLVSIAATTFEQQNDNGIDNTASSLQGKSGDAFDEAFINGMIDHHQGAIDMAELAKDKAKHKEIKQMADEIISAQSKEIDMLQGWQSDWNYRSVPNSHSKTSH